MKKSILILLISVFLIAAAISATAAPTLSVKPGYPLVGAKTQVLLDGADANAVYALTATYRPNSQTEETGPIGRLTGNGSVMWTPKYEGITRLTAVPEGKTDAASLVVATRFHGMPATGLLVFLLAFTILFGGMAWSIMTIYRGNPETETPGPHKVLADDVTED